MKTLLEGEVRRVEKHNNWTVEVFVKWNKRRIRIILKSRKNNLKDKFISCALTEAKFLSFISRSDAFNFSGGKSGFSELILRSAAAQSLMDSRNACIKLEGEHLIFKGSIRKSDTTSLSNIFILNEMLMKEIDELNNKSF